MTRQAVAGWLAAGFGPFSPYLSTYIFSASWWCTMLELQVHCIPLQWTQGPKAKQPVLLSRLGNPPSQLLSTYSWWSSFRCRSSCGMSTDHWRSPIWMSRIHGRCLCWSSSSLNSEMIHWNCSCCCSCRTHRSMRCSYCPGCLCHNWRLREAWLQRSWVRWVQAIRQGNPFPNLSHDGHDGHDSHESHVSLRWSAPGACDPFVSLCNSSLEIYGECWWHDVTWHVQYKVFPIWVSTPHASALLLPNPW